MSDIIFNVAKGKAAHWATLPDANDALIAVVLESTGLETDAVLKDHDTLAAILAATNVEQTTMGRKTLANVTPSVDDANDWAQIDCDDVVWAGATGNAVGALLICYDQDTTAGDDTTIVPIAKYDFVVTPSGGDVTAQMAATGFYRAS